eukprot:CAMPEP_0195530946 /NCGR_PEP_ID=MMETSP0794_2-20130614/34078_1 /TAXON_ID=515487 /ORGANISM="Stephanopyxis turris, Strain CCMP 815" /LENGTH=272 /DNA_ID=CAMNT_0040662571 /DNA_START=295 /DNA_END=1113 /DNA_ORIENTATION=+
MIGSSTKDNNNHQSSSSLQWSNTKRHTTNEGSNRNELPAVMFPRAAVSVAVRLCGQMFPHDDGSTNNNNNEDEPRYALIQRGKKGMPNYGILSLPGGKMELGETSIETAQRELMEETSLLKDVALKTSEEQPTASVVPVLKWHTPGPFCCTDFINYEEKEEKVVFQYMIAQCFAEVVLSPSIEHPFDDHQPVNKKEEEVGSGGFDTNNDNGLWNDSATSPPILTAADDAMDARWWTLTEVQRGVDEGLVTIGCDTVLLRAEALYSSGLLLCQ